MKIWFVLASLFWAVLSFGQDTTSLYKHKRLAVQDTILLEKVSINPSFFRLQTKTGKTLDSLLYKMDFVSGKLILFPKVKTLTDTLEIQYLRYPEFLTRDYFEFDPKIIVNSDEEITKKLQKLEQQNTTKTFTPFEGLNTLGSITRGITVGNNQNAVVNSELDLQITGKLSDKVSIRASIQDANIPTQEGGYSQNLDEFDQIFIELYSKNWNIRAGDINLESTGTFFGNFTKKVQGISLSGMMSLENEATLQAFASGALVRGVFSRSQVTGQDGNQGPYKLVGPNGELFVLIVSGSERVFVNGILLQRGENNDYVIDYNAGEITFNPTYPITDNMRITVEYQYTDRNYTRFIGYGGGKYTSQKWDIGTYVYTESDSKNQPLQQNLTEDQVAILQQAGDDPSLMVAPSAVPDTYAENKILYKKETINGIEVFVFSTNPDDQLFNVKFSLVGENNGNYVVSQTNTISRVYEYVAPVNGVKQGNYEPVIQLKAPERLQVGGITTRFNPSQKTTVAFEAAGSKKDNNLFSSIQDDDNTGYAGRLSIKQQLYKTDSLQLEAFGTTNFVHKNFRTVERLYNVEFARDWSLTTPKGNQLWVSTGVSLQDGKRGTLTYAFEKLDYSENFSGNRHVLTGRLKLGKWFWTSNNSMMNSEETDRKSSFLRTQNTLAYSYKKGWAGVHAASEDNQITIKQNDSLTPVSQRFLLINPFIGIGDSTRIFVETGYRHRVTDSVLNNRLTRVNTAQTVYLQSRLLQSNTANLQVFANYREVERKDEDQREKTLNARVLYQQSLFNSMVRLNTVIENNNGTLPQQEFTYVKVAQGEGIYTWNDYNNNGVQELEEFEVAQYQDQAEYIRVLLPNRIFIKTRENKVSQLITLNPSVWAQSEGIKKILSRFYNQTALTLNRKVKRDNKVFEFNPFKSGGDDELSLVRNVKNVLFYNRGKQRYTTSYTYLNASNKNSLSIGLFTTRLESHQLRFTHKIQASWLVTLESSLGSKSSTTENFPTRNYRLHNTAVSPKLSYLFSNQNRIEVFYQYKNKENQLGLLESLEQQKTGILFTFSKGQKSMINGEFTYIKNYFTGSAFSPVAYEILEGLQPGTNFTWQLLFQKKITRYLDLNLSYFGRKSEQSNTIHTGSMQLKAYF